MQENPKEIVCINIGQAGVQLSNAAWELFWIEHAIQANGKLMDSIESRTNYGFATFFEEIRGSQYVPRCVSIDLEPTVLDEVKMGPYKTLFHPDHLISGFEDASNNFARGYHTCGKSMINLAMERLRKIADNCENIQGFNLMNSFSGGTGSGFTSLLLSKMGVEYAKRAKFQVAIYPGTQLSTAVVEHYNTVMSVQSAKDSTDVIVLMDNESIYDICGLALDVSKPTFNNLNRLISQVFSSVTVSLRFENSLNSDLNQLVTNLIPYPIIHFPLANYAPIFSEARAKHQDMCTKEITRAIFERFCQMARCNISISRYMSCCLQYRGDVNPRDVNEAICEIKRRSDVRFVDWCPTGFKIGVNSQLFLSTPNHPLAAASKTLCMLSGNVGSREAWRGLRSKYKTLVSKRAFMHWFVGEGLEGSDFQEANEDIKVLEKDYEEIALDSVQRQEVEVLTALSMKSTMRSQSASKSQSPVKIQSTTKSQSTTKGLSSVHSKISENMNNFDENNIRQYVDHSISRAKPRYLSQNNCNPESYSRTLNENIVSRLDSKLNTSNFKMIKKLNKLQDRLTSMNDIYVNKYDCLEKSVDDLSRNTVYNDHEKVVSNDIICNKSVLVFNCKCFVFPTIINILKKTKLPVPIKPIFITAAPLRIQLRKSNPEAIKHACISEDSCICLKKKCMK